MDGGRVGSAAVGSPRLPERWRFGARPGPILDGAAGDSGLAAHVLVDGTAALDLDACARDVQVRAAHARAGQLIDDPLAQRLSGDGAVLARHAAVVALPMLRDHADVDAHAAVCRGRRSCCPSTEESGEGPPITSAVRCRLFGSGRWGKGERRQREPSCSDRRRLNNKPSPLVCQ